MSQRGAGIRDCASQQHVKPVTVSSMLRGLAQVRHSGRLEWLTETILLDAAHNPAGADKLADYLTEIRKEIDLPVTLLLGCSSEKRSSLNCYDFGECCGPYICDALLSSRRNPLQRSFVR